MPSTSHTVPYKSRQNNVTVSKNMGHRFCHQSLNVSVEDPVIQHLGAEYALKFKEGLHAGESNIRDSLFRRDRTISECPSSQNVSLNFNRSSISSVTTPIPHSPSHLLNSVTKVPTKATPVKSSKASSVYPGGPPMDLSTLLDEEAIDEALYSLVILADTYTASGRIQDAVSVMERAVFYQEKRICSGLQTHVSLIPLLTKLAQNQQLCGSFFDAKCTRDCVQHILDGEAVSIKLKKSINNINSRDPCYCYEGKSSRLNNRISVPYSACNRGSLERLGVTSLQESEVGKNSFYNMAPQKGECSHYSITLSSAGDASRGSIAARRKRNIYSYSFLESKAYEVGDVNEREM